MKNTESKLARTRRFEERQLGRLQKTAQNAGWRYYFLFLLVMIAVVNIIDELDRYKDRVIGTFLMPHIGESFSRQELPKLAKIMNRVFNFEPVVKIKKAKIYVAGYHIGYVTGAAHKFIKDVLADKRIDRSRVVVTCCGCSVQYQEDIRKEIEKYGDFGEILFQKASASIAASTGREAFGSFYTIK